MLLSSEYRRHHNGAVLQIKEGLQGLLSVFLYKSFDTSLDSFNARPQYMLLRHKKKYL